MTCVGIGVCSYAAKTGSTMMQSGDSRRLVPIQIDRVERGRGSHQRLICVGSNMSSHLHTRLPWRVAGVRLHWVVRANHAKRLRAIPHHPQVC